MLMGKHNALGYMLMAAKEINLDAETTKKLNEAMRKCFDRYTEEEAISMGNDWLYSLNKER